MIREAAEQITGSGCCGKLEGDNSRFRGDWVFAESRQVEEKTGEVARWLWEEFGDAIELTIVDPRNQLYLFPKIVRDVLCFRPQFGAALRSVCMAFSCPAILINGTVKFSRRIPERQEVVQAVDEAIALFPRGNRN